MRGTIQGQEHVLVDMEPTATRPETASTEQQRPRVGAKISRDLNPMNFKEHLREIDTTISIGIPNLVVPPLTDLVSDFANNMTKMVDFSKSKRNGTEKDKVMGSVVGLTSEMGFGSTNLALEPSFSHCNTVGQELSPTNGLFFIKSYTMKSSGGTEKRKEISTIQKKNK
nr:hypothetical protein CFP56_60585 [Quercus suber]